MRAVHPGAVAPADLPPVPVPDGLPEAPGWRPAPPGTETPRVFAIALDRLTEAMLTSVAIRRSSAEVWRAVLKMAAAAAPFGEEGATVEKVLAKIMSKLDAKLATLPPQPTVSNQ